MSPWYIRHLIRDYVTAGWTADDVMHALDHKPDGSAWTYTWTSRDQIRNVPGWVRFRLSAWLDEHGRPLPGKSQRLAAAAAELRAEQVRMRERFALAGVASASYSDQAARARELLVRSSPAAARAMRVRGREAARPREAGDERRWGRIDQQAREEIARRPRLVEALPLVEQPVVDEVAERRRVSLARARMRARAHRQNDKS
ncbi:hypothetical protein [Thermocatellispora tengchongensis]|uniref:hypothetical protein n=1 Tax=Thermocatellispora tengchongensis TaxID=1073253 RepID=UPI003641F3F8